MTDPSPSRTPSTSSSPDALSPVPKKRKTESISSLSEGRSDQDDLAHTSFGRDAVRYRLPELFAENIVAKIIRTASTSMSVPSLFTSPAGIPLAYPETVPQSGSGAGHYEFRDPEFWTCGFFPGSLYALLERATKYPQHMPSSSLTHNLSAELALRDLQFQLRSLSKSWSMSLHSMAFRTDTHDIGFIVMPALKRDWEMFGHEQSLRSIIQAARSLSTRYVSTAGAIRSWDCLIKKDITITNQAENLLVIIDSLCNLDLLFYASAHAGDSSLAELAAKHARTLLRTHLRPERAISVPKNGCQGQLYSTCHVANIDPSTGALKWRRTAQGYSNESTWARGQAWAILGYAQTYMWTKDPIFLDAACGCAEYFLQRLAISPSGVEIDLEPFSAYTAIPDDHKRWGGTGRSVPLWDFNAPVDCTEPLRDSSAGVIAANGMIILFQALMSLGQDTLARRFLDSAIEIVRDTIDSCLAAGKAHFVSGGKTIVVEDDIHGSTFEAILKNGTANNNEHARRRYANHGLVYGDYYLIEFGNRLLDLGLV
ncbi:hypothetical protein BDV06DRAFT_230603 [Aspergillus oleicola]